MRIAAAVAAMTLYLTCLGTARVSADTVPPAFFSCTNYHCKTGRDVQLSAAQWQRVRQLFTAVKSPAEERRQLRRAVALLERQTGSITGTWRDLGGNVAGAGQTGQLDCIAESRNTTTYLKLLSDAGLLDWHVVEPRQRRRPLLFNVHWTAVIRERPGDQRYAVDSWFLDNGEPPYIQPLADWKSGRRFEVRQENLADQ